MVQPVIAAGKLLAATLMSAALSVPATAWSQDDKLAAAEALLEATRVEAMMNQMYAQMPQMLAGLLPTGPNAPPPEDLQALMEKTMGFIDERIGYAALKPEYVTLYADTYTEEDMVALTEFMESPLGQRFLDASPDLMARTSTLVQQRMSEAMPELLEFVQSEVNALQQEQ